MNQPATYTADRLETLRRARDQSRSWSSLCRIAAALLLLLLGAVSVDYRLILAPASRWLLFGLLLACAAAGLARWIFLWRKPTSLKAAALDLESRRPDLGCLVSTAAEYLEGSRAVTHEYEPELVAALQESAARKLVLVETPWYRQKLLAAACLLGIAAAALALLLGSLPSASIAVERVLLPWTDSTYTRVEVLPGNVEIQEGSNLDITARFTGRAPDQPRIEWRLATTADWHTARLQSSPDGRHVYPLQNVRGPLQYRLAGGDAVSAEYEISTFVPPAIDQFHVTIHHPDYTGLEPADQTEPNFSAVRASRLEFRIATSGQVAKAQLRFADQPGLPLQRSTHSTWTATLTAERDLYYWVDLIDADGRVGGNEQPYTLSVRPDTPPDVAIFDPSLDLRADPSDRVPIQISVFDDFGIEDLALVFYKLGGPKQILECPVESTDPRQLTASAEIDLAPLGLNDYELVAYYATARDNNTLDGPGTGRSPVYFIEITSKERALSQCNSRGQRVNLLELQKQIIASTIALDSEADPQPFLDLAASQRQTLEYAAIFKEGFLLALAPPEARTEFASAMTAMDAASTQLEQRRRDPALEAGQRALAHLYQACRLLPELEAGMCRGEGGAIQIVLDAIEKLKDERERETARSLPEIVEEARRLARVQAVLNEIYRQAGQLAASPVAASLAAFQTHLGDLGAPASPSQLPGRSEPSESDPDGEGMPRLNDGHGVAEEQRKSSEAAAELAARLRELSGRNPIVSHRYTVQLRDVSRRFHEAQVGFLDGAPGVAANHGGAGLSALADVITRLEWLLDRTAPSDPAVEQYPAEYEALVAEYFRKLSFEQ